MFHSPIFKVFCRARAGLFILVAGVGLIGSLLSFLVPVLVGGFYQLFFHSEGSKGRLLEWLGIHFASMPVFFVAFGLLIACRFVAGWTENRLNAGLGEAWVRHLRERLFAAQLRIQPVAGDKSAFADTLLRYSSDLSAIRNSLVRGFFGLVKNGLVLIAGLGLLASMHPVLAVCFTGLVAGCFVLLVLFSSVQRRQVKKSTGRKSRQLAFVTRSFMRHARIHQRGEVEGVIHRFNQKSARLSEANRVANNQEGLRLASINAAQYLVIGVVLALMTIVQPTLNYTDALVFMLICLQLLAPLRNLYKAPGYLHRGRLSFDRVALLISRQDSSIPPSGKAGTAATLAASVSG